MPYIVKSQNTDRWLGAESRWVDDRADALVIDDYDEAHQLNHRDGSPWSVVIEAGHPVLDR